MPNMQSPQIAIQELDFSTQVKAAATSIACIVLRDTYKGKENDKIYTSNSDSLIDNFGQPTSSSYEDMFSALGYLKYGKNLYCTTVKPSSATFANTFATSGFPTSAASVNDTIDFSYASIELSGDSDYSITYKDADDDTISVNGALTFSTIGVDDTDELEESGLTVSDADKPFMVVAKDRGISGNNIRVAVISKKYYDEINGKTVTAELSASIAELATEYGTTTANIQALCTYPDFLQTDSPLTDNSDFLLLVQVKHQNSTS
jgi:hypothetical protein